MWIGLDYGNTRLKWVTVSGGQLSDINIGNKNDLTPLLSAAKAATAMWVSPNGSPQEQHQLTHTLATHAPHLPVHFFRSQAQAGGVLNSYQPPESLGTDRWLNLIGARALTQQAVVIVDAGTALTVDYLSAAGHYKGGIILPGLKLLSSSLSAATPLPSIAAPAVSVTQSLPNQTHAAISSGAQLAVAGAIEKFMQHYHLPPCLMLLTGGDAPTVQPFYPDAQVIPNLIFRGMNQLIEDSSRKQF